MRGPNAIKWGHNTHYSKKMLWRGPVALNHENSFPYKIPIPLPGTEMWQPQDICPIKKFWNPGTVASLSKIFFLLFWFGLVWYVEFV